MFSVGKMADSSASMDNCSTQTNENNENHQLLLPETDGDDSGKDPDYVCSTSDCTESLDNEVGDEVSK